jgi:hypothetical protein
MLNEFEGFHLSSVPFEMPHFIELGIMILRDVHLSSVPFEMPHFIG